MISLLRKQSKHAYRHVLSFGTQPPNKKLLLRRTRPRRSLVNSCFGAFKIAPLCSSSLSCFAPKTSFFGGSVNLTNFWGWFYKITDLTEKWCPQAASNGKRPEVNFSKNRIQLVTGASVNPMLHCQAIKALLEEQVRMVMEGQVTEVAETHHRISSGILKCLWKMLPQARWKADRVEFPDRVELCKGPHPLYVFSSLS